MRAVIADTGPINYLVLTGDTEILPVLFEKVLIPAAVWDERNHVDAAGCCYAVGSSANRSGWKYGPPISRRPSRAWMRGRRQRLLWRLSFRPICC